MKTTSHSRVLMNCRTYPRVISKKTGQSPAFQLRVPSASSQIRSSFHTCSHLNPLPIISFTYPIQLLIKSNINTPQNVRQIYLIYLNSHPIEIHHTEHPCGALTNQAVQMKNGAKKILIDPLLQCLTVLPAFVHTFIHLQKTLYPGQGHGESGQVEPRNTGLKAYTYFKQVFINSEMSA